LSSKSTFSNSTSRSYALALYELSKESSDLGKVENNIKSLNQLLNESASFKEIILSPTVSKEEKKNVLFALSDQNNFSKVLRKFLGFVATKNRLFFLEKIIHSFLSLVTTNRGELEAKLISSKKLSNEEQKKIQDDLSKDFKSQLNINYKYEPNLIGGLIVQIGSVMIDTSVKTKLKKIEKKMREA
tara:strand:- start:1213 stop:1770 length:558 start_codon:yes stop_codon:yes gene_type:complete